MEWNKKGIKFYLAPKMPEIIFLLLLFIILFLFCFLKELILVQYRFYGNYFFKMGFTVGHSWKL